MYIYIQDITSQYNLGTLDITQLLNETYLLHSIHTTSGNTAMELNKPLLQNTPTLRDLKPVVGNNNNVANVANNIKSVSGSSIGMKDKEGNSEGTAGTGSNSVPSMSILSISNSNAGNHIELEFIGGTVCDVELPAGTTSTISISDSIALERSSTVSMYCGDRYVYIYM